MSEGQPAKRRVLENREHFRTVYSPTGGDVAADGGRDFTGNTWLQICCRSQRSRQSIFRRSKSRPTIPGASADVMVSSVTTPLERQFGQIADWRHEFD